MDGQGKAFRDLTFLLILGIIFVFMVMASEFEDFTAKLKHNALQGDLFW